MDIAVVALLVIVVFVALLGAGRGQIAKGSNAQVANGAVLLSLATIVGVLALGVLLSLDVW
jgi:formate hydrogenlyase subunit 4